MLHLADIKQEACRCSQADFFFFFGMADLFGSCYTEFFSQ